MKRDAFTLAPDDVREIRHFHLFCGLGGGAKGFNKASPGSGTWSASSVASAGSTSMHRPFTTLELAALQSIIEPEEYLELDGLNDSDWRERIGNAVPPDAAEAIAGVMGTTLLLAWSGETFVLSAAPIWVRPVAVALTVAQGGM